MAGKNFDISRFAGTIAPVRSESDTMREIAIDKILDNPRNFYPKPDTKALAALEDSIRANGLLEPPTVIAAEDGTSYRLISGHSRMAAIRVLHAKTPEQWGTVPCRVLPAMSEEAEASAVIEANRQRVKSPALLAEEADKLTELYIKRREAGEDLPGRIRDRVAEALRVNSTKLANLAAIKRGIKSPELLSAWEQGEMPEAAALMIARMDTDTQFRLSDWMRAGQRTYTIREVRKFNLIWGYCKHKCPHTAGLCPNAEIMHDTCFKGGAWLCGGCCESCLRRDTCPAACQYVERRPAPEPEMPPVTTNPAVKDYRLDYRVMVPTFCQRVRELRERTGMSKKEFAQSIGEFPGTYSAYENNSMCGTEKVAKLALCFGVSTDYLFGLTDNPAPPVPDKEG